MAPNLRLPMVPPDALTSPYNSGLATPADPDAISVLTIHTLGDDNDDNNDDDDNSNDKTNDNSNETATSADDLRRLQLQRTHTTTSPYRLIPVWRKFLIVFVAAFTTLPVTFASTSLFPLTQEIATSLGSTASHIQVINALVLVLMGCSIFVWGPIGKIFGRKNAWLAATVVFALTTAGTALAPDAASSAGSRTGLAVFTAMRLISGIEGTFFHVAGQTWIADIFDPTERGTATGFFLVGTVMGPGIGPCIAGIMVTYTSWRSILWLQVAMSGVGFILSIMFLPDIRHGSSPSSSKPKKAIAADISQSDDSGSDLEKGAADAKVQKSNVEPPLTFLAVVKLFNPTNTFKAFLFPNVLLTDIACGCMSWAQYTLLTSPRHILNPRFNLTTPLVSGLFYLAPGIGFIIGTMVGGRYSDHVVHKHIALRGGLRLPQDRLRAGMPMFFLVIPGAQLVYGWCLHFNVGGLPVAVASAAVQAFGLLFAFASLNTYCAEALPRRRSEVIASKYLVQFATSAVGSAVVVPLIDKIGMGPATTISAFLVLLAGGLSLITAQYGITMERWAERKMPWLRAEYA